MTKFACEYFLRPLNVEQSEISGWSNLQPTNLTLVLGHRNDWYFTQGRESSHKDWRCWREKFNSNNGQFDNSFAGSFQANFMLCQLTSPPRGKYIILYYIILYYIILYYIILYYIILYYIILYYIILYYITLHYIILYYIILYYIILYYIILYYIILYFIILYYIILSYLKYFRCRGWRREGPWDAGTRLMFTRGIVQLDHVLRLWLSLCQWLSWKFLSNMTKILWTCL